MKMIAWEINWYYNIIGMLTYYQFQLRPLAVQEEGGDQQGKQSKDGCSWAQQPEIMFEIHEDKKQIYHHSTKG